MAQVIDCIDQLKTVLPSGTRAIVHSDQGTLYQLGPYRQQLDHLQLTPSISRKGNCLDNAIHV